MEDPGAPRSRLPNHLQVTALQNPEGRGIDTALEIGRQGKSAGGSLIGEGYDLLGREALHSDLNVIIRGRFETCWHLAAAQAIQGGFDMDTLDTLKIHAS